MPRVDVARRAAALLRHRRPQYHVRCKPLIAHSLRKRRCLYRSKLSRGSGAKDCITKFPAPASHAPNWCLMTSKATPAACHGSPILPAALGRGALWIACQVRWAWLRQQVGTASTPAVWHWVQHNMASVALDMAWFRYASWQRPRLSVCRVWDVRMAAPVRTLATGGVVTSIELSKDGRHLTTADGKEVKVEPRASTCGVVDCQV